MVDFEQQMNPFTSKPGDSATGQSDRVIPRLAETVHPRKPVMVRACIVYDNEGNYFIHGSNSETPQEMFKAMSSLWTMQPDKEAVNFVEFQAWLPDLDKIAKPKF